MNNSKESYKLGRTLSKQFVTAIKPDHPLTFSSPDILIGHEGKLFGIFIPKQVEYDDHFFLYSRIINSKLAYPDHMKIILLFDKNFEGKWNFKSPMNWPIDLMIPLKEKKELNKYVLKKDFKKKSFFNSRVKSHWNRVYEIIYPNLFLGENNSGGLNWIQNRKVIVKEEKGLIPQNSYEFTISTSLIEKSSSDFPKNFEITMESGELKQNLKVPKDIKRQDIELYNEDMIAIHSNYMISGEMDSYDHKGILFIEVDKIPTYRFDPLKSVRSLAFLGIAPYHKSMDIGLDSLKNKVQEEYSKIKRNFQ